MPNKRTRNITKPTAPATREPGLETEEEIEEAEADADEQPAPPTRPQPRATTAQARGAAQPMSAESLTRNVMCCLIGLVVGFGLGFFLPNKMIGEQGLRRGVRRRSRTAQRRRSIRRRRTANSRPVIQTSAA